MSNKAASADKSVELCLSGGGGSIRLFLDPLDRPLRAERTDAASRDFSPLASPFDSRAEFLGLSVLLGLLLLFPPGILDRRDRKDRDESLVSDLLIEG